MIVAVCTSTIKGNRTNCFSRETREVELRYCAELGSLFRLWFHLSNGVTGYESFEINPDSITDIKKNGWSACAGTPKRWDSLFVPAEEMTKALDDLLKTMGYIK